MTSPQPFRGTTAATGLVLVSHGSRDPRAAAVTESLATAVAAARPGVDVRVAGLEHALPRPDDVLEALAAKGCTAVTVVPLLLTAAYHARVDLPSVLDAVSPRMPAVDVAVADVLGPDDLLVTALTRRLAEVSGPFDAIVVAAAGTRDSDAAATVAVAARVLSTRTGLPCQAAFAASALPAVGDAVHAMRAAGAQRVGVASYFLAPGFLYDRARADALGAGAVAVAPPLGVATELVDVVLARAETARRRVRPARGAA